MCSSGEASACGEHIAINKCHSLWHEMKRTQPAGKQGEGAHLCSAACRYKPAAGGPGQDSELCGGACTTMRYTHTHRAPNAI